MCFLLPLILGPAAETALSRGVSFSGITLAITSQEEGDLPRQLETVLSGMQDVRRYCTVTAPEYRQALQQLDRGEVTAVLVLPEDFVQGILNGTNPDVTLLVSADRPLEALLTLWVGQSASELLAAAQSGIYTVLELYTENPPEDLSYQDAVMGINLRFISWTLNRQDLYRIQQIPVTDQLPLSLHYRLSLFIWLMLALAPMFSRIYSAEWICGQKRFRAIGIGYPRFCMATLLACWLVYGLFFGVFQLVSGADIGAALLSAVLNGLFCAAFGSFCCLTTGDTGSCCLVSLVGSLLFLALSGGILPPVLMPDFLQSRIVLSPVTWLRNVMAAASGYELPVSSTGAILLSALILCGGNAVLYANRGSREVRGS